MKKNLLVTFFGCIAAFILLTSESCESTPTSDTVQQQQQEQILAEGTSQVGMPAITNFRERKLMKELYEMRDQDGLVTYTYILNEINGKFIFLGQSIGYGLPYATQFSNPEKIAHYSSTYGITNLPQAEPNGLFMPASAEGTWVFLLDPNGSDVKPVYCEPRIIVLPFKLPANVVMN